MFDYTINQLKKRLESKKKALSEANTEVTSLQKLVTEYRTKLAFFSKVLEVKLQEKKNIEGILTKLINEVFEKEDTLKLEIIYDKDESLKGIKCLVSSDGVNFGSILDTYGEGEISIIIVILYILLLVVNDSVPKFITFDEPLAFLNKAKQARVNDFILSIVENTKIQVIWLTHQDDPIGRIVKVTKIKGSSSIQIIDPETE